MQVISGSGRGLKLNTPQTDHTRPTLSRVKEAVFSSLAQEVGECVFLDVFAGTGQIGIEAMSRGAKKVYFIENDKTALELLKQNIQKLKPQEQTYAVHFGDCLHVLDTMTPLQCDLIYLDPPHAYTETNALLQKIIVGNMLCDRGLIILEEGVNNQISLPEELIVLKTKKYGKTSIRYLEKR